MAKILTAQVIQKVLTSVKWNPKEKSTMNVIQDVGNSMYYRVRACEAISASDHGSLSHKRSQLILAIRCLILAIIEDENEPDQIQEQKGT